MRAPILTLVILCAPVLAQQADPLKAMEAERIRSLADAEKWPVKIFEVKHANPNDLQDLLSVFRAQVSARRIGPGQGVLIVRAPQDILPAIEDTLKRFDSPPPMMKNIELTAYLVVASDQADAGANLPSEMQGVIKQLKGVFPYQGFRLLDTLVLRAREGGEAELSGVAAGGNANTAPTLYTFKFRQARITSDEKGRVVSLRGLRLGARVPVVTGSFQTGVGGVGISPLVNTQFNYQDTGIISDVDVREGQKVVVGKANVAGPDKALFLVVTAKVMD